MFKDLKLNNPLKITEEDTIGSALFKSAAKGYAKTVIGGLIGLGALAYGVNKLNEISEITDYEEEETLTHKDDEKVEDDSKENWDKIEKITEENRKIVDGL